MTPPLPPVTPSSSSAASEARIPTYTPSSIRHTFTALERMQIRHALINVPGE